MISLDFETRSRADITECGAYRYAEDPSTEILVIAVSENGGPVHTWDVREPYQSSTAIGILRNAIDSGDEIHAFNSQFEWAILKYTWTRQFGYPAPDINNMRCTQAVCRHGGLPPSLAACAEFLNLEVQKDKLGKPLIRTFSIPQKANAEFLTHETPGTFTLGGERRTYAEAFQLFVDYCRRDVEAEMAVSRSMKPFHLRGLELDAFLFTARMNDRGVPVDVTALRNANRMFVDHEETLTKEFMAITGFTPNQNARVLEWMQSEGYPASSLDKKARASFNGSSFMSEKALRALDIKSELSFAAVKKVPTMLKWVMSDGRIRGSFKWCGAQKTGRWTSEGPQWQNMKKPEKGFRKVVDAAYDSVTRNVDIETMELCFGNPYETIASLARYFVRFPDCNIFDLDFAQVEARILPMLIECDRILESFLGGSDIYTVTATAISKALKAKFGVDEPLTRDHGKTIVLACIAEGEQVLTDRGLVPIEKVRCCDLVWDGVEWVRHEGTIYKGEKEVWKYDGLWATPDHEVFCRQEQGQERKVPIRDAVSNQDRIITSGRGRTPIRISDDHIGGLVSTERDAPVCESPLPMWERTGRELLVTDSWSFGVMQKMRGIKTDLCSEMASKTRSGTEGPLHQPEIESIQALRGARHRVSISRCEVSVPMGYREYRTPSREVTRPNKQRWSLRSGELAMVNAVRPDVEYTTDPSEEGHYGAGMALLVSGSSPFTLGWAIKGGYSQPCASFSNGETQRVASDRRIARVYDILNAGPRRRFTVSNKLVSNCQFNGGWNAVYNATGQRWKQEWCEEVVRIVRKENPEFPAAWRRFQDTMLAAFDAPDRWHRATKYVEFAYTEKAPFPRMYLRLPSGRRITWPHPKRDPITMVRVKRNGKSKWERIPNHFDSEDEIAEYLDLGDPFLNPGATLEMSFKSWDISFYGHVEQGHYGRVHTSGGDALQSATQGTGVELLTYGAMEAEKNGFLAFLLVHDQGLFPAIGDRELMEKCLCSVPDWFAGFPLEAEADVVRSYCKQ